MTIRVGIGGWTYAPWRGSFYPEGLRQADELAYAARAVTAIEINGTFYRNQSAKSFAKWRDETPDGFVFSLKGHRAIVNRRDLAGAGEAVDRFYGGGITELGDKLGPVLWQLPPFKRFDEDDLGAFLALLPRERDGLKLRHALEVRHESFRDPAFLDLARRHEIAIVYADSDKYPAIADITGPFAYARLQRARADEPKGYAPAELDAWAGRARQWRDGTVPPDLPSIGDGKGGATAGPLPVFVFMINGAKERAPHAAMALIDILGEGA